MKRFALATALLVMMGLSIGCGAEKKSTEMPAADAPAAPAADAPAADPPAEEGTAK